MIDNLKDLRTTAWRTSGARYNAARRLRRKELFSTISLALFSAFGIIIAIVQRIYSQSLTPSLDNYLTALSICIGLFILVFTLMEWGSANGSKGDALHRNAEELNALQRKIGQRISQTERGQEISWSDVDKLREDYEKIKGLCSHNHSPLDDKLFIASQRHAPEFTSQNIGHCKAVTSWIAWMSSSVWYYVIFWGITIFSIWIAFSKIIF